MAAVGMTIAAADLVTHAGADSARFANHRKYIGNRDASETGKAVTLATPVSRSSADVAR